MSKAEARKIDLNKSDKHKDTVNLFIKPLTPNAITTNRFLDSTGGNRFLTEGSLIEHHVEVSKRVKSGDLSDLEEMLTSQALLLNSIFCESANRAADNMTDYPKASQTYMTMALKAQSQCRCTVEALNEIKNPKSVTITKQANIADQQIVNNGKINTGARAEKNANKSNELLTEVKHEKVDNRRTATTKRTNKTVEAVEAINRRKDSRGKS